jgi:hypothetical protein
MPTTSELACSATHDDIARFKNYHFENPAVQKSDAVKRAAQGRPQPAAMAWARTEPARWVRCSLWVEHSKDFAMPRQLIEAHKGDKRYVRRDAEGHFTNRQVDVGRSLAVDRRSKSKTVAKKGEGDRGDQKRR